MLKKTGKGGSSHEFLKVKDALYRDTLVAIAVSSKIKDQEPLKLPELIQELQNEYEQKQRAVNYGNRLLSKLASGREFEGDSERKTAAYLSVREDLSTESTYKLSAEVEFRKKSNAGRSFGNYDHYQSHITSLEACGSDRAELYQIMVRDVNLLHQEQLSRRGVRTTQTQQQATCQEIYRQITTYQVRQTKGQASHKLDYDDQVKIASKIYDNLGSHKWWQSLVVQDLTHMHKLTLEAQEKMNACRR